MRGFCPSCVPRAPTGAAWMSPCCGRSSRGHPCRHSVVPGFPKHTPEGRPAQPQVPSGGPARPHPLPRAWASPCPPLPASRVGAPRPANSRQSSEWGVLLGSPLQHVARGGKVQRGTWPGRGGQGHPAQGSRTDPVRPLAAHNIQRQRPGVGGDTEAVSARRALGGRRARVSRMVSSVLRLAGFCREMGRVGGHGPVGGEGRVGAICHLGAVRSLADSRQACAGDIVSVPIRGCCPGGFCPMRGQLERTSPIRRYRRGQNRGGQSPRSDRGGWAMPRAPGTAPSLQERLCITVPFYRQEAKAPGAASEGLPGVSQQGTRLSPEPHVPRASVGSARDSPGSPAGQGTGTHHLGPSRLKVEASRGRGPGPLSLSLCLLTV